MVNVTTGRLEVGTSPPPVASGIVGVNKSLVSETNVVTGKPGVGTSPLPVAEGSSPVVGRDSKVSKRLVERLLLMADRMASFRPSVAIGAFNATASRCPPFNISRSSG